MSKEAYYFSHDSNARNDEKILAVRMKLGMEGYGIYWSILERMRENADYMCVKDYNIIAFDLRVAADKIKSLVEDFDLFQFTDDGKKFFSESFINRMSRKDEKSEKAKKAAAKRWNKTNEKQGVNADAMQTQSERNANGMPYKGKERKRKESKVKEKEKTKAKEFSPSLAFELIKSEKSEELNIFEMQNKKQVKKWQDLIDNFNDTAEIEISKGKIDFEADQLLPRLRKYTRSWINNQNSFQSQNNNQQQPATAPERF